MRIEQLADDNRRMQGAPRREWYRLHSAAHLRAVANLVERAIQSRKPRHPGRALVLGAGACTELPLERLARACPSVTLADLDRSGMEQARHELPRELRGKVHLRCTDITGGVSAALATLLRAQPWVDLAHLDQRAVFDTAAACLEQCPVPDPPPDLLGGASACSYGLVISSLVLTQLFSLPLLDVLDTIAPVVQGMVGLKDADGHYRVAADAFRRHVAQAHFDLLAALIASAGVGVFITDVSGYLVSTPQEMPHVITGDELPLLPRDQFDLRTELAARFTIQGDFLRWQWLTSLPTGAQPGRGYSVTGAVLRSLTGPSLRPE